MSIAFAEFETATQSEHFVPRAKATRTSLLHCLIVSSDAERREFFTGAAEAAGWQVTAQAEASEASAVAHRVRHSLAIVDLEGAEAGNCGGLRSLAEQLSTDAQRLLMVCGTEENPREEIWARQLGVWLYLSGVDTTCDIESLCSEAKQVADKLAAPAYARTA